MVRLNNVGDRAKSSPLWRTAACAALLVAATAAAAAPAGRAKPAPPAKAQAQAQALPSTPEAIERSWESTPWKVVSPQGYFLSGFKSETEYGDPKAHVAPTNPAPFNAEWQARYDKIRQAAFDGENTYDQGSDCTPFGVPFNMALGTMELLFTPGRLTIIHDGQGGLDRVWMDGRPHPKEILEPQYSGHAIGHWEGRTLVIDTVGLRGDRFLEPGMPHSEQLHVIQRWTQIAPDRIRNEITMIDPVAFTKPWKAVRIYGRTDPKDAPYEFLDFTCENNRSYTINGRTVLFDANGKPVTPDGK